MPISGVFIPASRASSVTVCTSHCSSRVAGCSMMRVPVLRLAIHFEMNSEISAPHMPNTAQNTSSAERFRSTPLAAMIELKPRIFRVMLASITIARLVSKNRPMRIISGYSSNGGRCLLEWGRR